MYNKQQISKFLTENLSLSELETLIYLDLLEHGTSTVLKIAERTKIKRPTVHRNIDGLILKGLTTQIKVGQGNTRKITAEPPHKLKSILSQKKFELSEAENELPQITKAITNLIPASNKNTATSVRYYEGVQNISLLYQEISQSKEVRAYVDPKSVQQLFPENPQMFNEALNRNSAMRMKEILQAPDTVTKEYTLNMTPERYSYKFADDQVDFRLIDYMMFDGNVAIVTLTEEPTATVINSDSFYKYSVAIFEMLWNCLPKPARS